MHVMISEKVANMIGQEKDIIGQRINLDIAPDKTLIIGGVFETLPENTHFHYDLILSMPSIGQFIWDGTENWNGNDRYNTYVKVYPGVDPATLETSIIEMISRHSDLEGLKRAGYDNLTYTLEPLLSLHSGLPATKRMALLLSVLSFTLIFTTVMNYILLVLSSLVNRVKNVAVRKTYGANIKDISLRLGTDCQNDLTVILINQQRQLNRYNNRHIITIETIAAFDCNKSIAALLFFEADVCKAAASNVLEKMILNGWAKIKSSHRKNRSALPLTQP